MNEMVSVIMPVHNAEDYIADAVQSCIDQSYTDWELVVVDDASSDRSSTIVQSFVDPRIRVIRLKQNVGPGPARNVALELAAGEWITVLDADDLYCEDRLAALVKAARTEGPGCVLTDQAKRWELESSPPKSFLSGQIDCETRARVRTLADWLTSSRWAQPFFHSSAVRDERVRYPDTRAAQDTAFFVRLVQLNEMRIVELLRNTYVYRRTPGSLVTKTRQRIEERRKTYELLSREFPLPPPLATAIRDQLLQNQLELQVLELRCMLSERKFGPAMRMTLAARGLAPHLVRRLPTWWRAKSSIRMRKRHQERSTLL